MKQCLSCNKTIPNRNTYCNNQCQADYRYKVYIEKWKNGEVDGGRGNWGKLSEHVRRYLFEKYNSQCSICGWGETNVYTKSIPLEIEHIDGNALNHSEENLTLICPNCHSLTATYRGANKGNGRGVTWTPSEKMKRV